jgi:hypothetical protein
MAAFTGITYTAGAEPLDDRQVSQTGYTHRFTIPYTALSSIAGGTTGDTIDVKVGNTPTRFLISKVGMDVTTAFVTSNTGTLTAALGISTSTAVYVGATDVLTAGVKVLLAGMVPAGTTSTTGTVSVILSVRFTTGTAGVLTDITAGSVSFYLKMIDMTTIDASNATI